MTRYSRWERINKVDDCRRQKNDNQRWKSKDQGRVKFQKDLTKQKSNYRPTPPSIHSLVLFQIWLVEVLGFPNLTVRLYASIFWIFTACHIEENKDVKSE